MKNFILLASLKQSSFDFYDIIPSCFVVFGFYAQLSGYFLSFFAIFFFFLCLLVPLRVLPSHLISFGHPENSLYTLMTIYSSSLSHVYNLIFCYHLNISTFISTGLSMHLEYNLLFYFTNQLPYLGFLFQSMALQPSIF